jgi:hypothetical protein
LGGGGGWEGVELMVREGVGEEMTQALYALMYNKALKILKINK